MYILDSTPTSLEQFQFFAIITLKYCTYLFFFPSITSLYEFLITCLPVIYLYFSAIFLGSRITADGDCSHEIKRHLLLGRKAMTNLDSVIKSRDISLPTKVRLVKAMIFPVVMYGCESWTIKNAEPKELMLGVGRRLLRVPWTAGRSKQSIQRKPTVNIHWKD